MSKKRLLSLILALSMAFSMSMVAYADSGVEVDAPIATAADATLEEGAWYIEAVEYAKGVGYMTNLETGFEPTVAADRATVFNALYMVEGSPDVTEPATFTDVEGKWYADAAAWAEDVGLSEGAGEGMFLGDNSTTRAEIATILVRYAEYKGISVPEADLTAFMDVAEVPEWAVEGMTSAVALGVINGVAATDAETGEPVLYLSPSTNTTRAELATMLMNYDKSVMALSTVSTSVTNGNREVPVAILMPELEGDEMVPAVVLVHGHGGSKSENGGFDSIATELAMAGYATIRMDFPGCGESTASFQENYLSNMLSDVEVSLNYLLENYSVDSERVAVLGYSMGGRIAAEFLTSEGNPFAAAIMLAGSLDDGSVLSTTLMGGQEGYDALYAEATENGYIDMPWFGGTLEISLEWFDEMAASKPLENAANYEGPILIIAGEMDTTVPMSVAELAMEAFPQHESLIIAEADHGYGFYSDQPEVTNMLEDGIVAFVEKALAAA